MDGDDLEESEPSEPQTLAEIFKQAFPYYLAMGMTYDEFWRGDPSLARDYRKAHDIKRHERNYEMWMQGRYTFEALHGAPLLVGFSKGGNVSNTVDYPDEPYPLTDKEALERQERDRIAAYKRTKEKLFAEANREREKRMEESKKGAVENVGD